MNTEIIFETARASHAGTISFPEAVGKLQATRVEYYHVDYVAMRTTFYSAERDVVVVPVAYEGLPPVASNFDAASLRAAILDSQCHGQNYRDLTQRSMAPAFRVTSPFCAASGSLTGDAGGD